MTDAHRVTLAELHSIEEAQGRLNAETALPFMYVAHEFYSHRTVAVDTTKPLIVQAETFGRQCEGFDRDYYCVPFELWSLAPVTHRQEDEDGGWVLLGEVDKFVPVSEQRFQGWKEGASRGTFSVTVIGGLMEKGVRVRVARVLKTTSVTAVVECVTLPAKLSCLSTTSSRCTCVAGVKHTAKGTDSSEQKRRRPNIVTVGDDVGYDNLGIFNGGKTVTPHLDAILGSEGIRLSQFHTFKICGPSRASTMTGRYPFNVGFYGDGVAQHITNYTTTAELLRQQGYNTSAIGKWDVGFVVKETTPTWKGFDNFLGYYKACNNDLFYHSTGKCHGETLTPTDMSRNVGENISPETGVNGTYSTRLFTEEAIRVLRDHFSTRKRERSLSTRPLPCT